MGNVERPWVPNECAEQLGGPVEGPSECLEHAEWALWTTAMMWG